MFETDGESINERGELSFCFIANKDGRKRYFDGFKKNNPYIEKLLPRIYSVSPERDIERLQSDLLLLREDALISKNCEVVVVCLRRQRHVTIAFHASAISIRKKPN